MGLRDHAWLDAGAGRSGPARSAAQRVRAVLPPHHREPDDDDDVAALTSYELSVLQALTWPLSRPRRSHWTRCCDEPCVQVSGVTWPCVLRWIASSPMAAAARRPSSTSPGSRVTLPGPLWACT